MADLRRDFADADLWADLAAQYYVRLPQWKTPCTEEKMKYWLRKFRVTPVKYLEETGYKTLAGFRELNPTWPLRAWVGLLLEYIHDRDNAGRVLRAYERD